MWGAVCSSHLHRCCVLLVLLLLQPQFECLPKKHTELERHEWWVTWHAWTVKFCVLITGWFLPGYWINAWKPFFSKIAIFCTNPKAENTWQLQDTQKLVKTACINRHHCLLQQVTSWSTSIVTTYCMFSTDASRILLSASCFFPSWS